METTKQIKLLSVWKTVIKISLKNPSTTPFFAKGGGGVSFRDETKRAARETRVNVIERIFHN